MPKKTEDFLAIMGVQKTPAKDVDVDREVAKDKLLDEICFLKDQADAIGLCIQERASRLETMMRDDGNVKRKSGGGTASFTSRTVYSVHSQEMLCALFTKRALAAIAKPTKAFVEAAKKLNIPVDKAVAIGVSESFKIERPRSKVAKEARERAISESADVIEKKVAEFMKSMED